MNPSISVESESEHRMAAVSKTSRFINFLVDITFWIIFCYCLYMLVDIPDALLPYLFPASFFLYFFIMEMLFQKTLGKYITQTKVVDLNGNRATPVVLFVRSLSRFLPFDQVSYMFLQRGVHDYLSSTMVVSDNRNEE